MSPRAPKESKFVSRLIQLAIEKAGSSRIIIDDLTREIADQVEETPELAKQCVFYYLRTRVNAKLRARRGDQRRVTVKEDPLAKDARWVNLPLRDATYAQKEHKVRKYQSVIKGAESEISRLEADNGNG